MSALWARYGFFILLVAVLAVHSAVAGPYIGVSAGVILTDRYSITSAAGAEISDDVFGIARIGWRFHLPHNLTLNAEVSHRSSLESGRDNGFEYGEVGFEWEFR